MALTTIDDRGLKTPIDLLDNEKIRFGTGNDLSIQHDGSNSFISETGTGNLLLSTDSGYIQLQKNTGEEMLKASVDGSVELYHNNVNKLNTESWGVTVQDDIKVIGAEGSHAQIRLIADEGDDNNDNWRLRAEDGGSIYLQNYADAAWETNLKGIGGGAIELYHNNTKKFETTSAGTNTVGIHIDDGANHDGDVNFYGANYNIYWDKSANALKFTDNAKLWVGDHDGSGDLQIYHDASNSFIKNTTGAFFVAGDDLRLTNAAQDELFIKGIADGAVELYYNNSKKFETTADGITVGNHVWTTGGNYTLGNNMYVGDGGRIDFGTGSDLKIYHDGSHSYIINSGTGVLHIQGNNSNDLKISPRDDEDSVVLKNNGAVELYHDNFKCFNTNSGGITLYGPEGGDCVINMYADEGDDNADFWRMIAGQGGGWYLKNFAPGSYDTMIAATVNAGVELYYDNNKKFQTESDGVRILGDSKIWFDAWQGRFDRNWDDYPSITITPSTTYGNQGEFRIHGQSGSLGGYGSGADFSIDMRVDGSYETGSDRRRKSNIEDITGALATVKQLTGKKFNIINRQGQLDPIKGTKKQFGLIAQECKDIIPEVVNFHPDEDTPNENGWASAYGLSYGNLTPLLINAIKELSAEVETLKTEVAALKAK